MLIPIFGMLTGVVTTGAIVWGIVQIVRIRTRSHGSPELEAEVNALREQVDMLQQQIGETVERLDFAERLLARGQTGASEIR